MLQVDDASTGNLSAANVSDGAIDIVERCHMRNQFAEWCIRGIEQAHVARNIILRNRLAAVRADQRPYTPPPTGTADALIKTMLREWAYRYAYPTSQHRAIP